MSKWDHFSEEELQCHCGCGEQKMDDSFMQKVVGLRKIWGLPMKISSAYRCANHPVEQKKDKPGVHHKGRAIDILISGESAYKLLSVIIGTGMFTGIGLNQKGNHNTRFIHIDNYTGIGRPNIWGY